MDIREARTGGEGRAPETFWGRLVESVRIWRWTPTQRTRTVTVLEIDAPIGRVVVREKQRLHFGRWGRWKWRRVVRYVLAPETVH